MMKFDEPEELRDGDLEALRELTKRRITERCGRIHQFMER